MRKATDNAISHKNVKMIIQIKIL